MSAMAWVAQRHMDALAVQATLPSSYVAAEKTSIPLDFLPEAGDFPADHFIDAAVAMEASSRDTLHALLQLETHDPIFHYGCACVSARDGKANRAMQEQLRSMQQQQQLLQQDIAEKPSKELMRVGDVRSISPVSILEGTPSVPNGPFPGALPSIGMDALSGSPERPWSL